MENKKYDLSVPTEDEQKNFMKEFSDLCDKHSMYFEPVPQYQRKDLESPWVTGCTIFLQKKTEIIIPEIVQEGAVASTDPEINPTM